jgi:hypothetical protein
MLAGIWVPGSALVSPGAAQARAQETTEDGTAAEPGSEPESGPDAQLILAPRDPVLSPLVDEYAFDALILNSEAEELPGGTLRLWVGDERIASREQLVAIEEETAAPALTLLAAVEVEATAAEGEREVTVTVPRDAMPLILESGVYPVRAELTATGVGSDEAAGSALTATVLTATTTVVWRGTPLGEQAALSVVVPLVLPDDVRTVPTRDDLGAAAPRLDALLTAAERWQATLAIDPRIISGIRAYGSAAPGAARDLLTRLEASTLPTFMLQFADADPAAEAALGFAELLQPTGLGFLTRLGRFDGSGNATGDDATGDDGTEAGIGTGAEAGEDAGEDAGESPDSDDEVEAEDDPDPENPAAPSLEQLLSWPAAVPGAWPAEGQANAATLELLRRSGIDSVVLRSDNLEGAAAPRALVDGFDALVADARVGEAARIALAGPTPVERAAGSAALVSELALSAEEPSTGFVLALDRAAVADAEAPAELLDALEALDWVTPTAALDLPQGTGTLRAGEISEQRVELLTSTMRVSDEIDALAPLLQHPGYLTQYQRVRLLEAFSTRYAGEGVDLAAVERRSAARDEELLAGVQVLPSENMQLVGTESRVPLLVHNALPFDARVTLRVAPTNAAIDVPERRFRDETVAAGGNTTVLVPVSSRVSSGESGLTVQVADAANDAVFFQTALHLTLRTSYETIMLVALGAMAALLLGFGVWRSVRRHRRPSANLE